MRRNFLSLLCACFALGLAGMSPGHAAVTNSPSLLTPEATPALTPDASSDKPQETIFDASPASSTASMEVAATAPVPAEPVLSNEERAIRFVGSFHPILVHFPIALLITAALAEFLYGFTGRRFFAPVPVFCVRIGATLAVLTALAGWAAASGGSDSPSDTAWVLEWHRWLGTGTAVIAVFAFVTSLWVTEHSGRGLFRWALYFSAIAVGVTGHFGGMLVYGVNYFKW